MPGLEDAGTEIAGGGEELDIDAQVIFVRDGGLMRVPASDRIYHLKDRRVLVPVDENGNALDPREDTLGEVDPLTELQARRTDELIDPKDNTIVVYAPPHFQKRLMLFVVLLWLSVTFFLVLSVIIPTVLGRAVLALKTNRAVHDIYSIMVGVYVLRGLWSLLDWISSKWHSFVTHGLQPINVRTQLQTVWGLFRTTAKLAYFGLTFGVIIPFLLGFMMELFVILPIRSSIEAHPIDTGNDASDNDTARAITGETGSIIFVVNWAVGLLYMKMVHRILSVMPNNRFAADMNRVFVGTNVNDWDTALATRRLILPVLGTFALAISLPLALAWIVVECLGLEGIQRLWVFRQTYPLALMISLLIIGLKESVSILRGWSQYVRDQEYLVGRQLHNHQDESIQQQQQQQQQQVQRTATATLQDQGRDTDYGYVPEAPIIPALQKQPSLESHGYEEYLDMARSHDLRRSTSRSPSLTSISFTSTTTGTKDEDYGPPLLRSNSRLIRDPPLASEGDDYENEGDSIAHRTRLRRSRRLQAQQAQDAMFDGK
ncbi:hypothetical protein EDD11_006222 [Mortierella claussenii]|nr:hypothetical protein EDD11_006222 [Mortierella claussenii]